MRVQVDQTMTSKFVEATPHAPSMPALKNLIARFNVDQAVLIGVLMIIWGGFIIAFSTM